jgi:hypothetical protein
MFRGARRHRPYALLLALIATLLACVFAAPASASERDWTRHDRYDRDDRHRCDRGNRERKVETSFRWLQGYNDPATPDQYDRVGVLRIGPRDARNILILNPGTSGGSAYFVPLGEDIVRATHGDWQVWSVERRENQLEDHSVLNGLKEGTVTPQESFDYSLGWLTDPSITNHFRLIPDEEVAYARGWGLNVEIEDLHRVVLAAKQAGRRIVMGGHSLGGSIITAYATWDFNGRPGAKNLDGLVYIDGGSNPTPLTPEQASASLANLQTSSPWLAFGGIPAPFLGLFSAGGSTLAIVAPHEKSIAQDWPLLPANIVAPVPADNEAQFGYAVDTDTSPPNLGAAQVHAGKLKTSGNPRGWDPAGEITPLQRWARMLSGTGLTNVDGSAWYHPSRLSLDAGAVAAGNANPAQAILNVKAIHGDDLSPHLKIYAFGASGGDRVLASAQVLATQSGIPSRNLTLVNREDTYAHNDPAAASPNNEFVDYLIPYLRSVRSTHDWSRRR